MDMHDELPVFDQEDVINTIITSNTDHFLRRNSYYELTLKILANFKECPIATMDTDGNIQFAIAHDTSFCSSKTEETYMRLLVRCKYKKTIKKTRNNRDNNRSLTR